MKCPLSENHMGSDYPYHLSSLLLSRIAASLASIQQLWWPTPIVAPEASCVDPDPKADAFYNIFIQVHIFSFKMGLHQSEGENHMSPCPYLQGVPQTLDSTKGLFGLIGEEGPWRSPCPTCL